MVGEDRMRQLGMHRENTIQKQRDGGERGRQGAKKIKENLKQAVREEETERWANEGMRRGRKVKMKTETSYGWKEAGFLLTPK